MKDKEYRDNRGNVVLLTVIAIVTMVIVLIGATFAYLASNIEGSESVNINATTSAGSDLFLITPGADLVLAANENNFGPENTNLSVSSISTVTFQTTNTVSGGVTRNYKVELEVAANDFEYSSGQCYQEPTGSGAIITGITMKDNCTGNNVWATNGSGYACYDGTSGLTPILNAQYSNELSCLSRNNYMWAPEEIAELVLDLYRDDISKVDQSSCESVGVCVNEKREIDTSKTSQALCEASDETWLANIWEDGACFHLETALDVTEVGDGSVTTLFSSIPINADVTVNGGSTTHLYKPVVTFINFSHNQIKNGQKNFGARLTFTLIGD